MSIAAQGETLDDLFVDDLSLTRRLATGISQTTMFLDQSKRDSCVLDAFHEELNIRYPKYQYFHLSPGRQFKFLPVHTVDLRINM